MTTQARPSNNREQSTSTLEASRPDGTDLPNPNPHHNPASNVIPRSASRELEDALFQV